MRGGRDHLLKGEATYEGKTGTSYAWVTEEGGKYKMTMSPIKVVYEGVTIPVGFGQFGVTLCARAGAPGTKECGGSSQPWVHENGEYSERGCSTGKGLFTATVTSSGGTTTLPARRLRQLGTGSPHADAGKHHQSQLDLLHPGDDDLCRSRGKRQRALLEQRECRRRGDLDPLDRANRPEPGRGGELPDDDALHPR